MEECNVFGSKYICMTPFNRRYVARLQFYASKFDQNNEPPPIPPAHNITSQLPFLYMCPKREDLSGHGLETEMPQMNPKEKNRLFPRIPDFIA